MQSGETGRLFKGSPGSSTYYSKTNYPKVMLKTMTSTFTVPLIGCAQPSAVESLMGPQSCVNLTSHGGVRTAIGTVSTLVLAVSSVRSLTVQVSLLIWCGVMQESREGAQGLLEPTLDSIYRVAFATFCGSEPDQPQYKGGGKDCRG